MASATLGARCTWLLSRQKKEENAMRRKRRGRRQPDFAGAVFGGTAGYIGAGAALGYGHLGATVHKAKKQFKSPRG